MSYKANTHSSITHHTSSKTLDPINTKRIIEEIKNRLHSNKNLEVSLDEALNLVDQLSEFDLGRFLLHNGSLNGYWTAYILRNQVNKKNIHPLESWFLHRSLLTLSRERFYRFQDIIKKNLRPNIKLASIPCGLMDDLLTLNYKGVQGIELVGIDLDEEALKLAYENADQHGLLKQLILLQKDAWCLVETDKYDLITSNGLNIYEPNTKKISRLYDSFYKALKPEGLLVISFLPPPLDYQDINYMRNNFGIDHQDLKRERTIFGEILQAKFLNFCTESEMVSQLKKVGFYIECINYSSIGVLPIVVARKKALLCLPKYS